MKSLRWVVSLSSGASSAVAAERTIRNKGAENVDLVFADTLIEDGDNYRFLSELEARWQKQIIRLAEGRTPYQLFTDRRIIPNDQFAPCTATLKIELLVSHVRGVQAAGFQPIMVIGYDLKDARPRKDKPFGRLGSTIRNWTALGAWLEFPLLHKPVELDTLATLKSWGIQPPRMYAQGYSHANCGGLCVKQGIGEWRRTLTHYPERFKEAEAWETNMRKDSHFAGYAILTRRGKPYPLAQLRAEVDTANVRQGRLFDMEADMERVCGTECGVGWDES
jgi:3'-phosphoadenosine 5'-phosphosulfate sulfotransferase (PAPS reductase)/FAD synthetase